MYYAGLFMLNDYSAVFSPDQESYAGCVFHIHNLADVKLIFILLAGFFQ